LTVEALDRKDFPQNRLKTNIQPVTGGTICLKEPGVRSGLDLGETRNFEVTLNFSKAPNSILVDGTN
jgi:hypothetical protein